ncbi:ATP-binding cassette sub-family A member 6 [Myotis brandtii]|uniref:ATP-binding cassette sub-family A member 6 n=1 Tax=Myotis brandtii TaxID=109478 RepID=S7MLG5_MYOBR|nr:ATP-binding cassette sub-family A member 6 [Myotis brandtii]
MNRKKKNVYQQTQALLCKNLLKKWRMKRESLLEWGFPVLLGLYMGLLSSTKYNTQFPGKPSQNLGRVDKYNNSFPFAVYTPVSNITKQIMNKTVSAPFLKETTVIGAPNQKSMDELLENHFPRAVGVIFSDTFSYELKFLHSYGIPFLKGDHLSAHCWNSGNEPSCSLTKYLSSGFVTLQAAIDAAIIEIALTFLMSVVLKKTSLTNFVVLLLTLFWGGVGLSALHRQLPSSLEWILSIFSPFAFTAGMAQIIHMDYNMNGVTFPDPSGDSYIMIATFFMLAFDAFWYLVLALYFDKILPYGNERRYSPLFFLNSSSCFQHQRIDNTIEKETDLEHTSDDDFEPMAPEFQGKEAIRIRNIKKEYKEKSGKVEALKGLLFDIYEGQITAILGHSGAGKSSLLNILNGFSVPTEGSVTIYNKNLSEMQDLEEIRTITGVCPQFNVHFDILTVKENLRLFAKIKGIQPQEVDQEVQRILLELDIQNIQDNPAQHLSEGQKRKLTFGIAILGDPKVLLLDEPTAGLDPFSRQQVWSFLKERKADHVILLSTSFMDEADILADRKVIMSNGRLKCAGSSGFLKRKWGLGYHLSLYRNEICDPERITSFINHHVPDAKLKTESKEKLVYTLPAERTDKFPDLFSDLDKGSVQGVVSYDIAVSTLNEVFKKVEEIPTVEQEMRDAESLPQMQLARPPFPVSDLELWRMQICAVARLRFLKLKCGKKTLLTLLLVFGIALFPLIVELIFDAVLSKKSEWEFKPGLYFLSPGQLPQDPLTSLLIINNTESNIEDFIQSLKHQNILLEIDDFVNRNSPDDLSYNGAIIVAGKQKDYRFSVVCNTKGLQCFPILMNIISNALLGMFNHTQQIRTLRSALRLNWLFFWTGLPEGSFFLFSVVCSISPYIAMSSVSDYKKRTKSQLWTSGLCPSAYWCGQALVDISLFAFFLSSSFLIFCLENIEDRYFTTRLVFASVVIIFGYAASVIFFTYVISFIFRKRRKNSGVWSFCFFITSSSLLDLVIVSHSLSSASLWSMVFFPSFALNGFLFFMIDRVYEHERQNEDLFYDLSGTDFLVCLIPYFQALLFAFVLRCMEMKCGQTVMRKDPVFRISPQRREARPNPEEPIDEDEDVQAERTRTATALMTTSSIEEQPVIIASCLHKEYAGPKKNCFSKKKKKKVVTRNISFCVKKGEVLGLLGPSGAGKSSSLRMISGVTKPTAGEVELKGWNSIWGDGSVKFLGYCPQENALWPTLTVREHLDLFAAVKGLRKADAAVAITRLVDAFKLHQELNVPVQKLTPGATRKLCFVLSILGNSPILILDEPSTGVDPTGQQQMWHMIQSTIKNTEKGALLTTQNLVEAETLCDRIAIMVSGRLRCIGSIQHLKNKLGKDYILELKVQEASQVTLVHTEILKLFPQAALQERYSTFLAYKLPVADVQPLSQAFYKLEAVKHNFNLEEYSLSQCTLEKVLVELSKEQTVGNFDEEVDTTMRWKLLSHSDDP